MSQWADKIGDHPVWQQLKDLGPAIDQAEARESIDPQSIDGLERVRGILAFAGKRLAGADTQLLYLVPLDGIASALQNAHSEIEAFAMDGDVSRVANANSHADAILSHLPAINYPFVADDWNALRDAGVAYRGALEGNLRQIHAALSTVRSESAALQQRIADLATESGAERAKAASLSSDFQASYTAAEETRRREFAAALQAVLSKIETDSATVQQRLAELGTEIGTERARLTALASDFQSQFSAAQETRNREFTDGQANRQDKFGNVIADYNQRLSDQNAEFSKQRDAAFREYEANVATLNAQYVKSAKGVLDEIQHHKKEVENLVGVIGNLGVTSGYLRTANYARRMTWMWQGITVAAMVGLIFVAIKAFLPLVQGTFTWEGFGGRVFVSLTVGVLAAYAGTQGDKYMQLEARNRKLALELEAIGPYLAPLPVEKQEEFRLMIGERSFGREDLGYAHKKSPATVVDVLKSKELREFIIDVVKSATPKG
jgi:hypothetical protein